MPVRQGFTLSRRHVLILLTAVGLLPLALAGGWSIHAAGQYRQRGVARAALDLARALSGTVDAELDGRVATLSSMAHAPAMAQGDIRAFYDIARAQAAAQPNWLGVSLTDAGGRSSNCMAGGCRPTAMARASEAASRWCCPRGAQAPVPVDASSSERAAVQGRVLLVDDNEDAAAVTAALLGQLGHEVGVAHSGHEALAAARKCLPEVAILDIGLPDMDGYALAGALRELAGEGVRLVALSGYGQKADVERAVAAGFDLHLTKPATLDDLRRAMDARQIPAT